MQCEREGEEEDVMMERRNDWMHVGSGDWGKERERDRKRERERLRVRV